jgi:flagellar P-ring protein precursor FlgI
MKHPRTLVSVVLTLLATLAIARPARADRIGDLCEVVGARENQLLGYGIVPGLNGTGDDTSAPFATQSLLALMRRLGVQIDPVQLRLKNVAAVMVTTTIPAFSRQGTHLDVTVSSAGNARSLQGGVLVQTLLMGADLHVYAAAQGPLILGGFEAKGASGSSVKSNVTTTARVPNGALIEREIPTTFAKDDVILLALRRANFATAARIVEAIDKELGPGSATAHDSGAVQVKLPASLKGKAVQALARHDHARGSAARLAAVAEARRHALGHRGPEVRIGQQDVGRFSTELLRDALRGRRRGLRDQRAGAGGAGDGNHVDVGVRGHGRADRLAGAVDEIEDARRNARIVQHLREEERAEG